MSHRDPYRCAEDSVFDRLLAAEALADQLLLASMDPAFGLFEGVMTLG